ncbi:caspase family protein [Streptomyces lincolnensis]|uniref:caspase family protein n=1 Tax=Streptomyces lincolnensis TaxID=1915 RepID=UPI001E580AB1|nr:caspase family protein [Streptomyces lincolnensis]
MAAFPTEDGGPPEPPPRRYLITATVPRVHAFPDLERPELASDVHRVEDLFVGLLGHERVAVTGPDPTKEQLLKALRAFAVSDERRPDDYVVLYFAGHGALAEQSGRHYLLTADSDRDLRGTALPTEELVAQLWEETGIERLLVLLDACHAEAGLDEALRGALQDRRFRPTSGRGPGNGLVMVASSRRKQETAPGALSAALDRAVRREATFAGRVPEHLRLDDVLKRVASDPDVPTWQEPVVATAHCTSGLPSFLPNPRHVRGAQGRRVDEGDELFARFTRGREERKAELTAHFDPRARGTDVPASEVAYFTGRHAALRTIGAWLAPERADERLCLVTGDPGSGKSALLGLVTVLADPRRRASLPRDGLPADALPAPGALHDSVLASHKSTRQILDRLGAAAGMGTVESSAALVRTLQRRTEPLVVVLDAVDEALVPQEVVDLVLALTDPALGLPLRLLVAARRHVTDQLSSGVLRVDLDDERYVDPPAVRAYVRKLFGAPGSTLADHRADHLGAIADAVAEAAGRSFLVALITARTLIREEPPADPYDPAWRAGLPTRPGQAMQRDLERRLGDGTRRARDLLLPLAFAQGAGLPWGGVWPSLATALAGREYTSEDIVWLREVAGSYLVETEEDGESVYRVYHRALIDHLRAGHATGFAQRTVTRVLRATDHPYARRYLARHAAEGGVLDDLVQDASFVLRARPGPLLAALPALRTPAGQAAGQALRDLEPLLRDHEGGGPDPTALARLRLAAVCRRADALARSCDQGVPLPWRARWAVWDAREGDRSLAGLPGGRGVVVPMPGGGARVVEPGDRGEALVRGRDLVTGRAVRTRRLPFTLYDTTLTVLPALGPCVAVLSADFGDVRSVTRRVLGSSEPKERPGFPLAHRLPGRADPAGRGTTVRREVAEARLLHVWRLDGTAGTDTWRLPAHPTLDQEGHARGLVPAEELTVLRARGGPRYAALRFTGGQVVVHALAETSDLPGLPRRRWRQIHPTDQALYNQLRAQRMATVSATLGPEVPGAGRHLRLPPVTRCAPAGALPDELLLGHADGSVTVYAADRHLTRRFAPGHEGAVTALEVVRPDGEGRLLVSAGRDGSVRLTALDTGEPVRTLHRGAAAVSAVAVHRVEPDGVEPGGVEPDGQWLAAVATADGLLHRIDVASGRPVGRPTRCGGAGERALTTLDLHGRPSVLVRLPGRPGAQVYALDTGERIGAPATRHEVTALCTVNGTVWVGGSDGVVRCWPTEHAANTTRVDAHDERILALGVIRGPRGVPAVVSVGQDHMIRCWSADGTAHELWHRSVPRPHPWEVPLIGAAAVGATADGRDVVVTGEYGGLVRVLVLRGGLAVAEQRFTVPETVTALCVGRVRGRDVVVVGTGTGRVSCWDVTGARWYARGPAPDRERWTTAVALGPDGRLAVGADDGTVQEWLLPACRPLGPPRTVHTRVAARDPLPGSTARVTGVAHLPGPDGPSLVSAGSDGRLEDVSGGPGHGLPAPATVLTSTTEGVLCGDERGDVFLLGRSGQKWRTLRALESVRPVTAVAVVEGADRTDVVAGGPDGEIAVRDLRDGTARGRLRPISDGGVAALSTEDGSGPVLLSRSAHGVVERWDLTEPARAWLGVADLRHRDTPGEWRLRLGRRRVLASWPDFSRRLETRTEVWAAVRDGLRMMVRQKLARRAPDPSLTGLLFRDLDEGTLFQGDVMGFGAQHVVARDDPVRPELFLGWDERVHVYGVDPDDPARAELVGAWYAPFPIRHLAPLPGPRCAVAGDGPGELALLGPGILDRDVPVTIPSVVVGLSAGPDGTLAVATPNGLVVLEVPSEVPAPSDER